MRPNSFLSSNRWGHILNIKYLILILDAGGNGQVGFFFLVVVGFYQRSYKSQVFRFISDKLDANTELTGFIFFAIDDLALYLNLVFMHIEKHQGEIFGLDLHEGFDPDAGLAHVANNRYILMNCFAIRVQT
jgi:hypothetical protein